MLQAHSLDILKLEFGPVTNGHRNVYGNWITSSYTLPSSGAIEFNLGSTTVRRLGIVGTSNGSVAKIGDGRVLT